MRQLSRAGWPRGPPAVSVPGKPGAGLSHVDRVEARQSHHGSERPDERDRACAERCRSDGDVRSLCPADSASAELRSHGTVRRCSGRGCACPANTGEHGKRRRAGVGTEQGAPTTGGGQGPGGGGAAPRLGIGRKPGWKPATVSNGSAAGQSLDRAQPLDRAKDDERETGR